MDWDTFWGFVGGFLIANLMNLIEFSMLVKMSQDLNKLVTKLNQSLKEFKLEGEDDKWLT